MYTYTFPVGSSSVLQMVEMVQGVLNKWKVSSKDSAVALLRIEELLNIMVQNAPADATVSIRLSRFGGRVSFHASCPGTAFTIDDIRKELSFEGDLLDEEKAVVQSLIDKLTDSKLRIHRKRGVNVCDLPVRVSEYRSLWRTVGALILGLLAGLAVKIFLPAGTAAWISENIFTVISTLFTNTLKMLVGPLVFFSIASGIAEAKDIKAFGRIAGKIMLCYVLTSLLAIAVGYGVFSLFPIGDPSLQNAVSSAAASTIASADSVTVSVSEMVLNIIPTNIVTPFQKSDMIQIIFMSILLGLGAAAVSGYSEAGNRIVSGISGINALLLRITSGVISFMPLAIFSSMAKMMISMDIGSLMKVILWVPVNYAGHFIMIVIYGLLLLIFARLNPIKFFSKYFPAMATAFSTMSSNATLPVSMDYCGRKLGISPRIYSLSIPLGATVNMDGNCITLIITGLFAARIYGVTITPSLLMTMVFVIIALSMGSPGVPGGNLVCMTVLLPAMGIPAEAVSLIMGLYSLAAMTQVTVNVTGDACATAIVAKWEKAIDQDVYNS